MIYIVGGLIVIMGGVVAGGIYLAHRDIGSPETHFMWFVLHFGVGALGILAVSALALLNRLDAAAAGIISSLVAYSLGAGTSRTSATTPAAAVVPARSDPSP
jgi:hypothetical protein